MYQTYKEIRDNAGMNDYKVSKATGISTATLTNWKYGRYTPKVDKLKKIADCLGVPVEKLLE